MNRREVEDKITEKRKLRLALESLREAYSQEQAGPSTEEQLLAEVRRAAHHTGPKRTLVWSRWALAAAAVLLACGLVIWLASRRNAEPERIAQSRTNQIRAGSVTAAGGSDRVASPPAKIVPAPQPRAAKKTSIRAAAPLARHLARSEKPQPAPFIATMIPAATDADYGLQLVRVQLPRRTMLSFGLPVDPRELNRPVKADLIIGPDGLTRAIRFVQE